MYWRMEEFDYVCSRCKYPDTEAIKEWQERRKKTHRARNIFRIGINKVTGKKVLFKGVEE